MDTWAWLCLFAALLPDGVGRAQCNDWMIFVWRAVNHVLLDLPHEGEELLLLDGHLRISYGKVPTEI